MLCLTFDINQIQTVKLVMDHCRHDDGASLTNAPLQTDEKKNACFLFSLLWSCGNPESDLIFP